MVEHPGFRKFMNTANPMFKVISIYTLTSNIMKIYEEEKSKVIKITERVQSQIL